MMLLVLQLACGLLVPIAPMPQQQLLLPSQQQQQFVASSIGAASALFPTVDSAALPTSGVLLADADSEEQELTEAEAKDRARLAGIGALAFGVLPSVWASSIGVGGAFDKNAKIDK